MAERTTAPTRTEPTWAQVHEVANAFRTKFGGAYDYIAAAIEHDHQSLKND